MDGTGVRGGPRTFSARISLSVSHGLAIEMTTRGGGGYVGIVDDVEITM